jgi:hypothetical protein
VVNRRHARPSGGDDHDPVYWRMMKLHVYGLDQDDPRCLFGYHGTIPCSTGYECDCGRPVGHHGSHACSRCGQRVK